MSKDWERQSDFCTFCVSPGNSVLAGDCFLSPLLYRRALIICMVTGFIWTHLYVRQKWVCTLTLHKVYIAGTLKYYIALQMTFNNLWRHWVPWYEYLICSSIMGYAFRITVFAGILIKSDLQTCFVAFTDKSQHTLIPELARIREYH